MDVVAAHTCSRQTSKRWILLLLLLLVDVKPNLDGNLNKSAATAAAAAAALCATYVSLFKTCPTPRAVKARLVEEFERYCDDMAACNKDGRSCKPRCLVLDGSAFALIEDAPVTSLHGPLVSHVFGGIVCCEERVCFWLRVSS